MQRQTLDSTYFLAFRKFIATSGKNATTAQTVHLPSSVHFIDSIYANSVGLFAHN